MDNDDHEAGLSDILANTPMFNATRPGLPYKARYDLNADHQVGLTGILMFIPFFNRTCVGWGSEEALWLVRQEGSCTVIA